MKVLNYNLPKEIVASTPLLRPKKHNFVSNQPWVSFGANESSFSFKKSYQEVVVDATSLSNKMTAINKSRTIVLNTIANIEKQIVFVENVCN